MVWTHKNQASLESIFNPPIDLASIEYSQRAAGSLERPPRYYSDTCFVDDDRPFPYVRIYVPNTNEVVPHDHVANMKEDMGITPAV